MRLRAEDFTAASRPVPTVEDFWRFVAERQRIYYHKEVRGVEPPWTADPILATYKFTNVYREADYCTRYIAAEMRRDTPMTVKLFQAVAFRLLNRVETFIALGGAPVPDPPYYSARWSRKYGRPYWREFRRGLLERRAQGVAPIFNDAYATCNASGGRGLSRVDCYCWALDGLSADLVPVSRAVFNSESLEAAWKAVCEGVRGVGGFIGYEIVNDLMYGPLRRFSENQFFIIGPGAVDALALLMGPAKDDASRREQIRELQGWDKYLRPWRRPDWHFPNGLPPSCAEVESCLCEWRKYLSLQLGRGKHRIYRRR